MSVVMLSLVKGTLTKCCSLLKYRYKELEHYHQLFQMCQMPNIWHIWHTNHKNYPSSAPPNLKKFETRLQYRLKYETVRIQMPFPENNFLFDIFSLLSIFNSMFSLSSHCFLSPSTSLTLSVLVALSVLALSPSPISPRRFRHRWSCHADLATPRDRDRPARHWSRSALRRRGTPVWRTRWPEVKLPSATMTEAVWDLGLFDLVDGMRFVEY